MPDATSSSTQTYPRITVEIWSDILCPFCYIGKRQFEAALARYPGRDSVEVVWRSFQLDPTLQTDPSKNPLRSLAERKGWSEAQTRDIMAHVTNMARGVGLEYHLDRSVVANSFDAHRLLQLGRRHSRQSEVKERLMAAYFTEGKNIADPAMLQAIGEAAGLPADAVRAMLQSDAYAQEVREDIAQAERFQITGVPFFVFNRRRGVSGAQGAEAFLGVLQELGQGK
ncbi:MAG: DsbA family oxidoreductase [Saprospiraceae bacterium]|nr:DsbA family oxidoreductase [Saprospiraceae bacterium]MDW8229919.1 DsbA family oxidoreductase [Saprospiraceae bacterium]